MSQQTEYERISEGMAEKVRLHADRVAGREPKHPIIVALQELHLDIENQLDMEGAINNQPAVDTLYWVGSKLHKIIADYSA